MLGPFLFRSQGHVLLVTQNLLFAFIQVFLFIEFKSLSGHDFNSENLNKGKKQKFWVRRRNDLGIEKEMVKAFLSFFSSVNRFLVFPKIERILIFIVNRGFVAFSRFHANVRGFGLHGRTDEKIAKTNQRLGRCEIAHGRSQ